MPNKTIAWFAQEMVWKVRNDTSGEWSEYQPELPDWAPEGFVSASNFIRVWAKAASLNDVKKQLFWLSLDDVQTKKDNISRFLEAQGYEPLAELQREDEVLLSDAQLIDLLLEGVITKQAEEPLPEEESIEEPVLLTEDELALFFEVSPPFVDELTRFFLLLRSLAIIICESEGTKVAIDRTPQVRTKPLGSQKP